MKGAVAWFAENHVASNLLMLFLLVAGVYTALTMKLEVFPEFSLDRITINTVYPGASPAEVEEAVIRRIEEKVAGLAGIKRIDSKAREGFGNVTIEVISGWDLKQLLDEVKAEVDAITTFPQEAEKPVVREVTNRHQVISIAVFGNAPEAAVKHLAEKIKDDITNLPEVTLADFFGVRQGEIHIDITEETLRRYGLTLGKVADIIKMASLDLPAGSVKTTGGEILIRTKGRRYYAADYRDVAVITGADGTKVTLGQIASLSDGFQDVDLSVRFQGKPAVIVEVYRVADQSALTVAEAVKRYVERIRPSLPLGMEIDFYRDRSKMLRSRLSLLLKNMAMGLILVSVLLGLFMNRRLAFWVTLGIPISFLSGLILLPHFDVSINMISLFAFITVLGIVVDDAIIIGENIFRKYEEGLSPLKAAVEGAMEVGRPVVFSVLTTVVAFSPLLMGGGTMGKVMRNLPWVVIFVLFGSLLESLFILPAHLTGSQRRAVARGGKVPRKEKQTVKWLNWIIRGPYARLLSLCIGWRYATVGLGLMVLLLTLGTWTGGWLKFTFFPAVEGDVMRCYVTMPAGTPVERTTEVVSHIEQSANKAMSERDAIRPQDAPPLMEHSVTMLGLQRSGRGSGRSSEIGSHLAYISIRLLDGEERDVSAAELTRLWRTKIGPIPDAESITFQSDLFRAGNPIEVHLSSDNDEDLLAAVEEFKSEISGYPGVFGVADSFLPGKEEMQLKLKPEARSLGLTLGDLAQQVRYAFYGAEALRLQRDKDEVKVMVRYPESERKSLGQVEKMRIRTPDGVSVPFSRVAQVKMERGFASIQRAQRY
ncbi:MAG: efflux RND transporter permease subunit, partial [Thermodesulfobacteriota bacterium]|nr:efflux RND transporter permease subunit [Thermodesulfobacteriota bacterium]